MIPFHLLKILEDTLQKRLLECPAGDTDTEKERVKEALSYIRDAAQQRAAAKAVAEIAALYVDPETGKEFEEWPSSADFVEDIRLILYTHGVAVGAP